MNILVTGANGFIGKNLVENLKNIRDGKNRTVSVAIDSIFEYDLDSSLEMLDEYCKKADFVFHFAGVNRPQHVEEFYQGNVSLLMKLLDSLKAHHNSCPVMLSSSIQARLDNDYGKSKKAAEDLLLAYSKESDAKALIYRFPNVFGKWCRPNYNSAVATFCHNIANDLPITVNDENTELTLVYIDDLIHELVNALQGKENRAGDYCEVPVTYCETLGDITRLLYSFRHWEELLLLPEIPDNSFEKKLLSAYLSYLPAERAVISFRTNYDHRGSFTELLHTKNNGQISVNISKPGVTKGQHWHNTKWELFIVVSGHALIQQRKIGSDEILEFEVCGDELKAVYMLPGYTHNIINLSETDDLITLMWANENFDSQHPDTYFEEV